MSMRRIFVFGVVYLNFGIFLGGVIKGFLKRCCVFWYGYGFGIWYLVWDVINKMIVFEDNYEK